MNIRRHIPVFSLAAAIILSASCIRAADIPRDTTIAYVGTYTNAQSKGIYAFALATPNQADSQTISLTPIGLAAQVTSPSFLAVDLKHRFLFAVNEVDKTAGQPGGGVSSFAINQQTGMLTAI